MSYQETFYNEESPAKHGVWKGIPTVYYIYLVGKPKRSNLNPYTFVDEHR
jgi:hypothetical protein